MSEFQYEITPRLIEKFTDKWEHQGTCWIWTGCTKKNGYGEMAVARHPTLPKWFNDYAERISYQIYVGSIPTHYKIIQTCNHKNCVNPDHLLSTSIRSPRSPNKTNNGVNL